MNYNLTA